VGGKDDQRRKNDLFKTMMALLVGLSLESVGNVLLRKGMLEVGEAKKIDIPSLFGVFIRGVTNPTVISGIALDAMFFVCFLLALSWSEVSVVMPLTALGYVSTALVAKLILHEDITTLRWVGTIAIVMGCALVGKTGAH